MSTTFDFTQTGGFPLDQNILKLLQESIQQKGRIARALGLLVILTGCEVNGSNVADGLVAIDGEVMNFKGGTVGSKIIIVQQATNLTYADTVQRPSQVERYATFGDDGATTLLWANFKRDSGDGLFARMAAAEVKATGLSTSVDSLNATAARKLASGSIYVGDVPSAGALYSVIFPAELPTSSYFVLLSMYSNSGSPVNDKILMPGIRSQSTTGFSFWLNEPSANTQNIGFTYLILSL